MFKIPSIHNKQENHNDRRYFLTQLCALGVMGVSPALTGCMSKEKRAEQEIILGAQGDKPQHYAITWLNNKTTKEKIKHALSGFRGHGVAQHPLHPSFAIMIARRPGTTAIEINLRNGEINHTFHCAANRHFLGHGCFDKTGTHLFTTEADLKTGSGKIVIRDALTYQHIGEYESYGIGPHELALMPDGKTLVIANGGILTHPDTGRKKLNLDSMDSNLTYIDITNGQRLDAFKVTESKASIRHLAVSEKGTVVFAMQFQRSSAKHNNSVPLGGIHAPEKPIQLLDKPENLIQQMDDYMGSVAINHQQRVAGFTSPRGNIVCFWDIDNQRFKGYHTLNDVCGIAVTDDQQHFVISNSFGQLQHLDATTLKENKTKRKTSEGLRWDNHLLIAKITA